MNLAESFPQSEWNVNHNSFAVSRDIHVNSLVDVEIFQLAFQLLVSVLQIKQSLRKKIPSYS